MPRRPALAIAGAAAGVALLFVTWFAAFHVGFLHRADVSILRGFADLQHPRVDPIAKAIAGLCDPNPFVFLAAVPVLVALLRRRPRLAITIAAILFGANLTTQLLKPLLAEPRSAAMLGGGISVDSASWPSGHATAAMSLALASVLAAPRRVRPLVAALGAVFAIAVSYSFLTLGWHYPSDVVGGFLIAVTWTLLGAVVLFAPDRIPRPAAGSGRRLSAREALGPPAAVVIAGLVVVGLVALARPHSVITYARLHTTFIVGAAAIGTVALVLATGVVWLSTLGRPER
jgi:membrane-associated phospholipid phosphatase